MGMVLLPAHCSSMVLMKPMFSLHTTTDYRFASSFLLPSSLLLKSDSGWMRTERLSLQSKESSAMASTLSRAYALLLHRTYKYFLSCRLIRLFSAW